MHPECEIHLIRKAEGTSHIGDHIGSFEDGDLYIVGRGLPHNWVTPLARDEKVEGRDVVIQFDEDRILQASGPIPELEGLRHFLVTARRGIAFRGNARERGAILMESIGRCHGIERLALFFSLLHLLSSTRERTLLSSESFAPNSDISKRNAVRDILTWISENFASDIRLVQMAEKVGMTESSFSRFFKKNTGTTFIRYLSELRMAKACELLIRSDLAITAISHEVGYDNLSNFNRTFRELRGMPPSRYRQSRQLATH